MKKMTTNRRLEASLRQLHFEDSGDPCGKKFPHSTNYRPNDVSKVRLCTSRTRTHTTNVSTHTHLSLTLTLSWFRDEEGRDRETDWERMGEIVRKRVVSGGRKNEGERDRERENWFRREREWEREGNRELVPEEGGQREE